MIATRSTNVLTRLKISAFLIVFAAGMSVAVKYVAVVETDIDAASGAAATFTSADARLVTAELRREAVNNLPRGMYNVMTSETVQSMGGAVLEECSEENCVIALGSKIGADFIVRGTISKVQTMFTLTVELYETDNGTLMAASNPVRAEGIVNLLEKAAAAGADMYKKFVDTQSATQKQPTTPVTYTVAAAANPAKGGYVARSLHKADYNAGEPLTLTAISYHGYMFTGWSGAVTDTINPVRITVDANKELTANFQRSPKPKPAPKPVKEKPQTYAAKKRPDGLETPERKLMTGFTAGGGLSVDEYSDAKFLQIGYVTSIPISQKITSLNIESSAWIGSFNYDDRSAQAYTAAGPFGGVTIPITALFQLSWFSAEAGIHGDMILGESTVFDFGLTVGAGVGFDKKQSRRYFYRYNNGFNYCTHVVGMRWMF